MRRYVVFRPDPQQGWRVAYEEYVSKTKTWRPISQPVDFPLEDNFTLALDYATKEAAEEQHEVFVPQGSYSEGLLAEEDVANQALAGKAKEE